MHRTIPRPSPALVIAIAALFLALAGTATAAIIVASPDQLGDRVVTARAMDFDSVTSSQLADGAVHGVHLTDPHLSARVNANGTKPSFGFDALETKRLGIGLYQVQFSDFNLRGRTLKNCSITVTPRISLANDNAIVAEASAADGLIVTVAIDEILPQGGSRSIDNPFDVTAAC